MSLTLKHYLISLNYLTFSSATKTDTCCKTRCQGLSRSTSKEILRKRQGNLGTLRNAHSAQPCIINVEGKAAQKREGKKKRKKNAQPTKGAHVKTIGTLKITSF